VVHAHASSIRVGGKQNHSKERASPLQLIALTVAMAHQPSPRGGHTTSIVSHYAIVFGGSNNELALNDTWALDLGWFLAVVCRSLCVCLERRVFFENAPLPYHSASRRSFR
jgi:hypothetical protein